MRAAPVITTILEALAILPDLLLCGRMGISLLFPSGDHRLDPLPRAREVALASLGKLFSALPQRQGFLKA